MNISRREKTLLAVLVYALLIFGGYKFIISPTRAELSKVKATNSQLDTQVQQSVLNGKLNSSYKSAISKELTDYSQLKEQLPNDKQLVELVDQLGNMADENDVTLLTVAYSNANQPKNTGGQVVAKASPETSNLDLSLGISGSYYHLLSYLQALEQSQRIVIVKSATIAVGQYEATTAVATAATGASTAPSSTNPPPEAPIAKGTRLQTAAAATGTTAVSAPAQTEPAEPAMTKYDLGNVQMNLQISSYYVQTGSELDKLLSSKQIALLTGDGSNTTSDANTKLVATAVKKCWSKDSPRADWSNTRNPGNNCWNGKLLKYLEGKYNNTNMGKNVKGLVNPLAKKINPDSNWAGTAIYNWDRILDMKMSSMVNPVDPDTGKTYANIPTRDFFPVAVYITYLPNYAPDKVASLSDSQKQAVMGSIIVWQAKGSTDAPQVYRINEKGQMEGLIK